MVSSDGVAASRRRSIRRFGKVSKIGRLSAMLLLLQKLLASLAIRSAPIAAILITIISNLERLLLILSQMRRGHTKILQFLRHLLIRFLHDLPHLLLLLQAGFLGTLTARLALILRLLIHAEAARFN